MRLVDTIAAIANPVVRVVGNCPYINATAGETDNFINTLKDKMVLAGWTLISSTVTSGHPDHKLESAQSPWWDELTTPPSAYVGKLRMRIFATSNDFVRFQAMTVDETFIQNTARVGLFGPGATNNWRYNINPYQLLIQHPTANNRYIIASAFHTPRWFQEDGLEEAFLVMNGASNGFQAFLYGANCNAFYKIKSASYNFQLDINPTLEPALQAITQYIGRKDTRTASPINDPSFNDITKRSPFHIPATIGLNLTNVDVENNWRWFGWLWDAIVIATNSTAKPWILTFDNGMRFESHTVSTDVAIGTLLFRIS